MGSAGRGAGIAAGDAIGKCRAESLKARFEVADESGKEIIASGSLLDAPNLGGKTVELSAAEVDAKLGELAKDEDLSRYIL